MKSLSTKVLIILLGMFILSAIANYLILQKSIFPEFHELEQQEGRRSLNRIFAAIERELFFLNTLCADRATWNDTYKFIETESTEYITNNLNTYSFTANQLNYIGIIRINGDILWQETYDNQGKPTATPILPQKSVPLTHPLIRTIVESAQPVDEKVSGIYHVDDTLLLVSTYPILTSEHKGPIAGYLVMGRYLDQPEIDHLSEQLQLTFEIYSSEPSTSDAFSLTAALKGKTTLSNQSITCESNLPNELLIYSTLPDLNGNNALVIKLTHPKKISVRGQHAISIALISFLGSWLFITLILLWLLQDTIILPVVKLTRKMLKIRQTGNLSARITSSRKDEIGTLSNEFNRLMIILDQQADEQKQVTAKLKEIDHMRNEFISAAAHELNTPLSSIMGYTEFLHYPERFGEFSLDQQSEFIDEIYSSCLALELVINDIIDIGRFESGQKVPLKVSEISLQDVIDKVVRRFRIQAKNHQFMVVAQDLEQILIDRQRIIQVLDNLLSNAVKYSPEGGSIIITLKKENNRAIITIVDQGIGMTKDQQQRVFDKFYRADASNTAIEGLGLGMSIVKQIVEAHGGQIRVESELGRGTTMTVELPFL